MFAVLLVLLSLGLSVLSGAAEPVSRPFLLPVPPTAEYVAYVDVQRLRGQPFLERLVAPFTRDPYFFQRPGASALGAIAFYGFFEGFPDWSLMLADGDFDLGDGSADLETFRYVGFSPSHVVYRPMLDSFGRVVLERFRAVAVGSTSAFFSMDVFDVGHGSLSPRVSTAYDLRLKVEALPVEHAEAPPRSGSERGRTASSTDGTLRPLRRDSFIGGQLREPGLPGESRPT